MTQKSAIQIWNRLTTVEFEQAYGTTEFGLMILSHDLSPRLTDNTKEYATVERKKAADFLRALADALESK